MFARLVYIPECCLNNFETHNKKALPMKPFDYMSPDGNASETIVPVTREHKFETVIFNEAGDAFPCEVSYIYHDDPDYRVVSQITTNMFECTLKESEVEWQIKEEIRGLEKGYEVEFLGDVEYIKS